MLHARKDYNRRIQDSENLIGEVEPVFLLRAKDALTVPTLRQYLYALRQVKNFDKPLEAGVIRLIALAKIWQAEHGCEPPDTPIEELEDSEIEDVSDEDVTMETATGETHEGIDEQLEQAEEDKKE